MSAEQRGQCPLCRAVYSTKDSAEHWKLVQHWVEKKKPWAQIMLGQKILDDQGDEQVAAKLFRLAAEQGNPIAQFNLGILYSDGCGVVQSDTMMKTWFLEAANQGYAPAIKSLSELVEYDTLSLASLNGNVYSQITLGDLHFHGDGAAEQSFEIAFNLYTMAATAVYRLCGMYYEGLGVVQCEVTRCNKSLQVPKQTNLGTKDMMRMIGTDHLAMFVVKTAWRNEWHL
mgnify:CR=1 FL=1